jgi:hypothetical protein
VNQLTVEVVYDSSKKFAGWKAQPSKFKAEYGGATDRGNIYLRDCGDEVTSQPAKVKIRLAFCVNKTGLFEEVAHRRDLLSTILMAPRVGEEEVVGAVLPASESFLASATACGSTVGRSWAVSPAIECRAGMVQHAVEKDSRRLEGKSKK